MHGDPQLLNPLCRALYDDGRIVYEDRDNSRRVDSPITRQVLLLQKECTSFLFFCCGLMRRVMIGVEIAIRFSVLVTLVDGSASTGARRDGCCQMGWRR